MIKGIARQKAPIVFKSREPVSIICVATTFTGVTYANNGGKVQLSSAGVHGLTTSPAVGAKVYVSWSGGTGVSGLYTVLSVDSTTAITVDLVYVAGLGTPSVAKPGTDISLFSAYIPPLAKNSYVVMNGGYSLMASGGNRKIVSKIENDDAGAYFVSPSHIAARLPYAIIQNQNSKNQQAIIAFNFGSSMATANKTTNMDTSLPTLVGFFARCYAENETITLNSAIIEVFI